MITATILYILLSFVMGSILARTERHYVDGPDFFIYCALWFIIVPVKLLRLFGINFGKAFNWWIEKINK